MQSDFLLQIQDVYFSFTTKKYGKKQSGAIGDDFKNINIFEKLNLNFTGEEKVIAIVGCNGAGKTTLCRLMMNIYEPTLGVIKRNCEIRQVDGQNIGMNDHLTGAENIQLLSYYMYPKATKYERNKLIKWAQEFSGLKDDLHTQLLTYSKGMKSKVYVSIALAKSSEILILDEAIDSLDLEFKEKISIQLNELVNKAKITFIVSHNEADLQSRCTHGILLDDSIEPEIRPINEAMNIYKKISFNRSTLGQRI